MGWDDQNKDKDPWGGKNEPPDLDEAFKRFQQRLKKTLLGSKNSKGKKGEPAGNASLLFGLFFLMVLVLWALSGIFIVGPAEQAAVLRFGKYERTVGPGPHWIPRIISSKIVQNVERISHYSYSAQMLTQDENLVSVSLVVQYRIGDLEKYLFNVVDPIESLRQTTSSALRQVVGKTTLNQIVTEGREAWGKDVYETLVDTLKIYNTGLVVVNVSPQPARAPESVQDAFDDAIKAQEDEKRYKNQAYGYEARVVPIAEGNAKRIIESAQADAEQVVFKAKGDVAGYLAILPEYEKAPKVTAQRMYLDAMQRVLSASTKIIVDSKAGNLLYLPLEKLGLSVAEMKKTPSLDDSSDTLTMRKETVQQELVDDRVLSRNVYRPGRNR